MHKRLSSLASAVTNGWLIAAAVILLCQSVIIRQLSVREVNVPVPELSSVPQSFDSWRVSREQTLEPEVLDFLQPDAYILRDYASVQRNASMNLFVAFFKSLQNTAGPHSPHDCLPGSGWLITSSAVPKLPVPGHPEGVQVNQYTMEKGGERILVVYWYQNNRHTWAQEFKAKLTLLPDLIRYRRSDVSLVRLVTPMREGGVDEALSNAREFTRLVFPSLVGVFDQSGHN